MLLWSDPSDSQRRTRIAANPCGRPASGRRFSAGQSPRGLASHRGPEGAAVQGALRASRSGFLEELSLYSGLGLRYGNDPGPVDAMRGRLPRIVRQRAGVAMTTLTDHQGHQGSGLGSVTNAALVPMLLFESSPPDPVTKENDRREAALPTADSRTIPDSW